MPVTKIVPPYRAAHGRGDTEFDHEATQCRFYGVIDKPKLSGTIMSPDEVEDQRSSYTESQQHELKWRTGDWQGTTEPSPDFANGIALGITGEVRLTSNRNINVINDDGSNRHYLGVITMGLSEGDPKLSRLHAVPPFDMEDEKVEESVGFQLYITRAQLEFLFNELRGCNATISFRLDVWGFMFPPERSFATFRQTQDYFIERTAIVSGFSVSAVSGEELSVNESNAVIESPPVLLPNVIDYKPQLHGLNRGLSALTTVSAITVVLLLIRTCAGH